MYGPSISKDSPRSLSLPVLEPYNLSTSISITNPVENAFLWYWCGLLTELRKFVPSWWNWNRKNRRIYDSLEVFLLGYSAKYSFYINECTSKIAITLRKLNKKSHGCKSPILQGLYLLRFTSMTYFIHDFPALDKSEVGKFYLKNQYWQKKA